jgi:general stress protein YciG
VSKKGAPSDDVREFLREIGRKGGKARAKKYDTKTFRRWSKKSGAGRPPKRKKEDQ